MNDIFKYCTKEEMQKFLFSLHLWEKEEETLPILYTLSNHIDKHYKECRIPKKKGSFRVLHIPDPLLKKVQRNLLSTLGQIPISSYAKAYHKGASPKENAKPHLKAKILLKLDIEDFYDHIDYIKVYNLVFKKEIFPKPLRTLLTTLCLYEDILPQGAPTSPTISNIIMKPFDDEIGSWCENRQITYTRYADDLIFSGDFSVQAVIHKVSSFLNKMGFSLNKSKTKVLKSHQKQIVTGIVVNDHMQVDRSYRKKIRQEIYYIQKFGIESHRKNIKDIDTYKNHLLGKINYVLQVHPNDKECIAYRKYLLKKEKK